MQTEEFLIFLPHLKRQTWTSAFFCAERSRNMLPDSPGSLHSKPHGTCNFLIPPPDQAQAWDQTPGLGWAGLLLPQHAAALFTKAALS